MDRGTSLPEHPRPVGKLSGAGTGDHKDAVQLFPHGSCLRYERRVTELLEAVPLTIQIDREKERKYNGDHGTSVTTKYINPTPERFDGE
ncbi:hypothetical protein [Saliphagus sp. LR7]|uniref:hypothetical protein n=1 Tax=Saliphagus sp. LR7 TaxID=2282654 RepID=UPI00130022B2|nr:hypothetical protein [Saliphagus sp. LR7]